MRKKQKRRLCRVVKTRRGGLWEEEGSGGLQISARAVHIVRGPVEGEPHSFPNVRGASLRQLDSVERRVHAEGRHLGFRKPLPEETEDTSQRVMTSQGDRCLHYLGFCEYRVLHILTPVSDPPLRSLLITTLGLNINPH